LIALAEIDAATSSDRSHALVCCDGLCSAARQ
jgi:hypothetical protein